MGRIENRISKLIRMHKFIQACEVIAMHRPTMGNEWARAWALKVQEVAIR